MITDVVVPICLVLGGTVAAAPLILSRFPDMGPALQTLGRHQQWLGILLLLFGCWQLLFHFLPQLTQITLLQFLAIVTMLALGFLFSHPLLHRLLYARHPAARSKAQGLRRGLVPMLVPIGLVAIVVGILTLLT